MNWIKKIILNIDFCVKVFLRLIFKKNMLRKIIEKGCFCEFPIYIISYNRLEYVKQTVEWLTNSGYKNIIIIDNNSDYQPLLDYFNICKCKVIRLKKNFGHMVFYKCPRFIFKRLFTFYALTDPDLTPVYNCPHDFIEQFLGIMEKYPKVAKVGFSLKIDDLPDAYYLKEEVLLWEKKFYSDVLMDSRFDYDIYRANLDTTFAINSPSIFVPYKFHYDGIRTGVPYQVRHLPWYVESKTEEIEHYQKTLRKDVSNWNGNVAKEQMQKRIKKHEL